MIMQVLSQGPSLLLAVWTGLALLEGGESGHALEPPYPVSISGDRSIGSTTRLGITCSTSGMVEWYQWYHNGTHIRTITSTENTVHYIKSPAQLTDSGDYYCKPCNRYGCGRSSSTWTVRVTALEPPYPVSIRGDRSIGSTTGLGITCSASGMVEWYQWYHNGTYILIITSTENTVHYIKSPAQLTDSGDYYCKPCNRYGCGRSSSTWTVTVTAPSSATISGSRTVGYTQRLHLTCSVSGIANSYQWYRNYIRLSSTSRYYSKSAQQNDSGSYQCRACNWAGCTSYSSSHRVTVTAAPTYSVSISGSRRILYTNRLGLTCVASGIVNTTTWYRNGNKLINSTSRSYVISSAQLSDSGSYQCVACNWAGCVGSGNYTIRVIDVPDAVNVSSIEVTNTTFDTISIQWTPPNNNFDSIIEYRVDLYGSGGLVGVFTSSQPMITLVSLQPFTTYQIRIAARNNAGWGGNSSERNVNTLTRAGCPLGFFNISPNTTEVNQEDTQTVEHLKCGSCNATKGDLGYLEGELFCHYCWNSVSPILSKILFPQEQKPNGMLLHWKIPDLITCKLDGFTVSVFDMTTNETSRVEVDSHVETFHFRKITHGNRYQFSIEMRKNRELSKAAVFAMSII